MTSKLKPKQVQVNVEIYLLSRPLTPEQVPLRLAQPFLSDAELYAPAPR